MSAPPTRPGVVPLPGPELPASWRLAPGVALLWRGDGAFQLEAADDGVVVAGLDRAVAAGLARPPHDAGPRERRAADRRSEPDPVDLAALSRLAELGYVREVPRAPSAHAPLAAAGPAALATVDLRRDDAPPPADLDENAAAAGGGTGDVTGGAAGGAIAGGVARRAALRTTRVEVVGLTATAAYVGALVAAAGVGAVGFTGAGPVRRRHLVPGGLTAADEGRRFAAAAADVVARAAPRTDVGPPGEHEPDLVLLCLDAPAEPDLRALLHRTRRAHLLIHVDSSRGEVGPLVLPGVSSCLRCADLHRLDHDPSWSVLAVQLLARAGLGEPPDTALTARTGVLAAALAVQWLAGDPLAGGTLDGSWEVRPGAVVPRRRSRRPHPECGCRAAWGTT